MSMTKSEHLRYRRFRAPRDDRGVLIEPPAESVAGLLADNRRLCDVQCYDLQGRCLTSIARQARSEVLDEAWRWTTSYRDVAGGKPDALHYILVAGHQPELFHPGVWFKNFMLARLADQHGGCAINLVIDTDVAKRMAILVPGGSARDPSLASIAIDRADSGMPFEERRIEDREFFARFGDRVTRHLGPLVSGPLVETYWPLALARMRETDNLGDCLAQSRHQLEGQWGLNTLEVPESRVCECDSFRWLVVHLLAHLPRFRDAYNAVVGEYRRIHGIRSRSHPVPDLGQEEEWLEAPLWMWSAEAPRRRRLFARRRRGQIEVADRRGEQFSLALDIDGDGTLAVEQLAEASRRGIKIRSRALVTTLWARVALGDLFLHGIGGAKYDQVTDALIARFFGLEPPRYMVVSATLKLPIMHQSATEDDIRGIDQKLRELTWHPELYIDAQARVPQGLPDSEQLAAEKRRWIETQPTREIARHRFLEIRRLNEALQPWVSAERTRLESERAQMASFLRAERILSSRDYSFCLYPEGLLRETLPALVP
jgi:hypothetical protein